VTFLRFIQTLLPWTRGFDSGLDQTSDNPSIVIDTGRAGAAPSQTAGLETNVLRPRVIAEFTFLRLGGPSASHTPGRPGSRRPLDSTGRTDPGSRSTGPATPSREEHARGGALRDRRRRWAAPWTSTTAATGGRVPGPREGGAGRKLMVAHFARFDIAIDFLDPLSAAGRIVGRHLYPFSPHEWGQRSRSNREVGRPGRGLPSTELPLVPEEG